MKTEPKTIKEWLELTEAPEDYTYHADQGRRGVLADHIEHDDHMAGEKIFQRHKFPKKIITEMAPPHVERDELIRHLIKHKIPIKRRESSRISDSEYLHIDTGDLRDEYGDKVGDKLLKVRISDHRATRHAIQKHGAADVEIGPHGHSVQHGLKKILQHAGINEINPKGSWIRNRDHNIHEAQKKLDQAYGWLNDKGSFVRNRNKDSHYKTYMKKGPYKSGEEPISSALNNGWARLYITKQDKTLDGVIQHRKKGWTPRHERGLSLVKRALTKRRDVKDQVIRDVTEDAYDTRITGVDSAPKKMDGTSRKTKNTEHIYGWLNKKGSFIRNRGRETHVDSYQRMSTVPKSVTNTKDAEVIGRHALKKGWTRLIIDKDRYGLIHKSKKHPMTDRHLKTLDKLQRAIGVEHKPNHVETYNESNDAAHGWINHKGEIVHFAEMKSVFDLRERAIMYHGAREKFTKFDETKMQPGAYGRGIYTTNDKSLAKTYSGGGKPMKVDVHLKNPHMVNLDLPYTHPDAVASRKIFRQKDKTEHLKKLGHDGILVKQGKYREAIAFHPDSAKIVSEEVAQRINYQMLSNYSLGQRVRYNDQLAALEVARRKRFAGHQFQHHPTQRALVQTRDDTLANPTTLGVKTKWIREKIDSVAAELGFPKEKIHLTDEKYEFVLNGKQFRASGVFFPRGSTQMGIAPGYIVIYGNPNFDQDRAVGGLTAHEIMHAKFDKVMKEYSKEYEKQQGEFTDKYFFNGKLKSVFRHEFPLTWELQKTSLLKGGNKLSESDGVTNYSTAYWNVFFKEPHQRAFNTAVDETLAEIANLHFEVGISSNMSPASRYKKMNAFLPKYFKEQRKLRGDAFATEHELEGILSDPWAHLSLIDTQALKSLGITNLHDLSISHGARTAKINPSFMPPAAIKPEWRKLYDTIITLYDKLKDK